MSTASQPTTAQTTTAQPTTAQPSTAQPATAVPGKRRGGLGGFLAMARAELTILLRNRTATFYAIGFAPLMVLAFSALPTADMIAAALGEGGFTTFVVLLLSTVGLTMAIYYNLTTAVVARREKLVLKRLISGESSTGQVLAAVAVPNLVIFFLQFAAVLAVASFAFGAPSFTNPVLIVLGLVLGSAFAVALAYLTASMTNTVEAAQMTTMPGMVIGLLISGVLFPLALAPDILARILEFLPVYPIMQLLSLGLSGTTIAGESLDFAGTWVAAAQPTLVIIAWTALAIMLVRRMMRWEPRR